MNRDEFIKKSNERVKLVRTEYGYTQEQLSAILGISKKTLVEIEKGRSSLGWTGSVAFCSIFTNSEILSGVFGGETTDMVMALAFEGGEPKYPKTMGGRIWWRTIEEVNGCKIQQNILSQHYRALGEGSRRICASFELEEVKQHLTIK